MKSCYLDANFLVSLQDPRSAFYPQAEAVIQKLISDGFIFFTSALALDEFLMGSLRLSGKSAKEMRNNLKVALKGIFKLPRFNLALPPVEPEKHLRVVNLMVKFNLRPRDAYHLLIILENKIRYLATFDSDFEAVFAKGTVQKFPV